MWGVMVAGLCVLWFTATAGAVPLESWDDKIPNANQRFKVLSEFSDSAVLDKETQLVWEKSPATNSGSWSGAISFCINKNVGGRKGWRLPSIPELASLIDPTQSNPSLPAGHPFLNVQTVQNDFYWSATTVDAVPAGDPSRAWTVRFLDGLVTDIDKSAPDLTWCVRGGMNADAY
jgi:Protein of unknown function (DUF1566)